MKTKHYLIKFLSVLTNLSVDNYLDILGLIDYFFPFF